jgi:hypothetical protein
MTLNRHLLVQIFNTKFKIQPLNCLGYEVSFAWNIPNVVAINWSTLYKTQLNLQYWPKWRWTDIILVQTLNIKFKLHPLNCSIAILRSIPGGFWEFFSSPPRPERLRGPPSLLPNGYQVLFSRGAKRAGREADHSLPTSAEVKVWVELYIHSPNTPSWRGAKLKKHRDNFTFYLYLYR